MKTLLYILAFILMAGCCTSKIPTQYISSGVIIMPDYTRSVKANGNFCCIDTLVQRPEQGYVFDKDLATPVTIMSYDCYGHVKTVEFYMKTLE